MRVMVSTGCILSLLTACGSIPTVVTKPIAVVVEKQSYVQLPPDLIAGCQNKPPVLQQSATNGDLLWSYIGLVNSYVPCMEEKLESIRRLQPNATDTTAH